jgi:hypothetical protein
VDVYLGIPELQQAAHAATVAAGFTDTLKDVPLQIALMHTELSEAMGAWREPGKKDEHLPNADPVALEMADAVIRIMTFCEANGHDLGALVEAKIEYNAQRTHKHGGKRA